MLNALSKWRCKVCNMTKALGSIINCKIVGLNVVLQNFVLDTQCWKPINITHMKKKLQKFIGCLHQTSSSWNI
jgi:hypothetical protein